MNVGRHLRLVEFSVLFEDKIRLRVENRICKACILNAENGLQFAALLDLG